VRPLQFGIWIPTVIASLKLAMMKNSHTTLDYVQGFWKAAANKPLLVSGTQTSSRTIAGKR
jgi:hypothetical protein